MFVEKNITEEVKVRDEKYRNEKNRKYDERYYRGGTVRQIHSGGILTRIIFL